jgi:hypothetical protein
MKVIVKYLIVILFTLISATSYCQVKIGYIFGMNLSTLKVKSQGIASNPDMQVGFHWGASFDIPATDNFSFHPAIMLSAKGSDYTINSIDYSLAPIFLEAPLLAMYSFGSGEVRFSVFTGPYFAIGVAGYKVEQSGDLHNINYGGGSSSDLKSFDTGFNFGAGVKFKSTMISAQYGLGLANLSPDQSEGSEMKNRVIGITISSSFFK